MRNESFKYTAPETYTAGYITPIEAMGAYLCGVVTKTPSINPNDVKALSPAALELAYVQSTQGANITPEDMAYLLAASAEELNDTGTCPLMV